MSFSYTNTTAADQEIGSTALGMVTNYARITDEPAEAKVSNKTASLEQPEHITYRCRGIDKVFVEMPVRNPSPVQSGVQYSIKLETINRITSGSDVIDEPVSAWLTIRHPASNNWDNMAVAGILNRLLSACMKGQTTTGTGTKTVSWRFEDLMRSACMPTVD